jgi:hypothetical protein
MQTNGSARRIDAQTRLGSANMAFKKKTRKAEAAIGNGAVLTVCTPATPAPEFWPSDGLLGCLVL